MLINQMTKNYFSCLNFGLVEQEFAYRTTATGFNISLLGDLSGMIEFCTGTVCDRL